MMGINPAQGNGKDPTRNPPFFRNIDQTTLQVQASPSACGTDMLGLAFRTFVASTVLGSSVHVGLIWGFALWIYVLDIQFAGFMVFEVYALLSSKGICVNSYYRGQWR